MIKRMVRIFKLRYHLEKIKRCQHTFYPVKSQFTKNWVRCTRCGVSRVLEDE